MKNVLYISNIEVSYRTKFFNELSKKCNLTVLYERRKSKNRNENWTKSEKSNYKIEFLNGVKIKNESAFSFKIFKYILDKKYDTIIFGCYNSFVQMITILFMKLFRKKYSLNIDGEVFINENSGLKNKIKKFFIRGAEKYFVASEKSAEAIKNITKSNNIYPYYFSSLTTKEIEENRKNINVNKNNYILVVGQYFYYKGLDIALEVASKDKSLKYKFVGMGYRTEIFEEKAKELNCLDNIKIIPFLEKKELFKEYQNCKMLLLPSRQECWGLVINEAASFGCPIVSTYGSGSAIELLEDKYSQFIAKPNDVGDLYQKIKNLNHYDNIEEYKNYLMEISKKYNIENMVKKHIEAIENT